MFTPGLYSFHSTVWVLSWILRFRNENIFESRWNKTQHDPFQLGVANDPSTPVITGTTVFIFHISFSSDAFIVTKTKQLLLICAMVQTSSRLHYSTFRLESKKRLGLLLNMLFFFGPYTFVYLSRSTFSFSFQLHFSVPVLYLTFRQPN